MIKISVCVGSSCHLKGSYQTIDLLKQYIESHPFKSSIELRAAFCLGHCTDGISIKINDEIIHGVHKDNIHTSLIPVIERKIQALYGK